MLRECGRLHADSDGVFRARNPRTGALDTAGFVKGYAIGRAAAHLRDRGAAPLHGGSRGRRALRAVAPSDGRPWRVAIQDPAASHGVLALVDATDTAVATSGTAERGEHIWLPGPRPVGSGLRSFTVVGPGHRGGRRLRDDRVRDGGGRHGLGALPRGLPVARRPHRRNRENRRRTSLGSVSPVPVPDYDDARHRPTGSTSRSRSRCAARSPATGPASSTPPHCDAWPPRRRSWSRARPTSPGPG